MKTGIRDLVCCAIITSCLLLAVSAFGKARPAAQENSCNDFLHALRNTPDAVQYANTGKFSKNDRPVHSRAWYLAALGMADQLRSYLNAHPEQRHDPALLLVATYTGQRNVVVMLLKMGDNPNAPGRKMRVLPLQYAASCARPLIMIDLLQAGANVYGTTSDSGTLAMAGAVVGSGGVPFERGVRYLLAAGFDSRCPVAKTGVTAVEAVKRGEQAGGETASRRELESLLTTAAEIAAAAHPGRPRCGGLNWWHRNSIDQGRR